VDSLLEVRNIKKYFPIKSGILKRTSGNVKAVDDVSFFIRRGEIFGLVGESGCGKSTLGKVILRLLEPTAGEIFFQGLRMSDLESKEMRELRKSMQMIFQDPQASLNPRMTVYDIVSRPLKTFGLLNSKSSEEQIFVLLEKVGLQEDDMDRFPYELSGGQQQRVGIARALCLNPQFLVLDEPTSSLDVSIQSQIVNLLMQLHSDFGLSYLFISHNLSLIKFVSQRIAVMYLGKIVELADKRELFQNIAHPYTRALISAIPTVTRNVQRERTILQGTTSSAMSFTEGCRFRSRCCHVQKICNSEPQLVEIATRHYVACHLHD